MILLGTRVESELKDWAEPSAWVGDREAETLGLQGYLAHREDSAGPLLNQKGESIDGWFVWPLASYAGLVVENDDRDQAFSPIVLIPCTENVK